jgi:hypothetical protein
MISTTLAYRISLGGAVVVLLLVASSLFRAAPMACGGLPASYAPVIAEELARTPADLAAIFGFGPSACRTAIAGQLNLVTLIDCLAFVPAYGAFLLFFFLAMVPRDEHAAFIGFVLSAAAVIGDYLENACLFQVTAMPDNPGLWLSVLPWATGVKWLALGLAGAVGGMILMKLGRVNYPAVAACALGLVGTVIGIANPALFGPYISDAVTLSWIVFLIVDIRGVAAGFSRAAA